MRYPLFRASAQLASALFLSLATTAALGEDFKMVEGVSAYLGVVPAAAIGGRSSDPVETSMHGGRPSAPSQYHVMVALFDANSGQRITDAVVRARVSNAKGSSLEETLEPMTIANAVTYGNYFAMPEAGSYKVTVHIYRPNLPNVIEAQFEHKRP